MLSDISYGKFQDHLLGNRGATIFLIIKLCKKVFVQVLTLEVVLRQYSWDTTTPSRSRCAPIQLQLVSRSEYHLQYAIYASHMQQIPRYV